MESGNSSSMQSSSGGDDQEYESSGGVNIASSTNYYTTPSNINDNNNNITAQASQYNNPTTFMLSPPQQPPQPPLLSPLQSTYLDAFDTQTSNYHNLMFWQPQHHQHFGGVSGGVSGGSGGSGGGGGLSDHLTMNNPTSIVSTTHLSAHSGGAGAKPSTSQHAGGSGGGGAAGGGKNPRKRTRASRRAPTTVLTTDTSNFRAMVQEFTGIPSSPFSAAASPLLSRRLSDLLSGSLSNPGSALRPPPPPPPLMGPTTTSLERILAGYNHSTNYPLRPSALKLNNINITENNNNQQNIHTNSNATGTVSPLSNLSLQSILQSNTGPSPVRYPPSVSGLLSPNVGNFQDLSGMIGNDAVFGFGPMRLTPDSGGWRGGSSGGGGLGSTHEGGDRSEGNININVNNEGINKNNDDNNNNQEMEGSISGGGTSNYNVNINGSRDKGLDSITPNRGGAQEDLQLFNYCENINQGRHNNLKAPLPIMEMNLVEVLAIHKALEITEANQDF